MIHNMYTVSIHQPNYFPWFNYFYKIFKSDIFIFLDRVTYPKSGNSMGSYCNRVYIASEDEARWLACPVKRESGVQLICDVKIRDREEHLKNLNIIYANYKNHEYFKEFFPVLEGIFLQSVETLGEFNVNAIMQLCGFIGIKTIFKKQTMLNAEGTSSQLLINLIKEVGGTVYLSGTGGSKTYLAPVFFDENNFEMRFLHPISLIYPQKNVTEFIPNLSIIDVIMNYGKENLLEFIYEN